MGITKGHCPPYGHYGCFSYGDPDGFPPLLPLKSLHRSLKLILCGLILRILTLRLRWVPVAAPGVHSQPSLCLTFYL